MRGVIRLTLGTHFLYKTVAYEFRPRRQSAKYRSEVMLCCGLAQFEVMYVTELRLRRVLAGESPPATFWLATQVKERAASARGANQLKNVFYSRQSHNSGIGYSLIKI